MKRDRFICLNCNREMAMSAEAFEQMLNGIILPCNNCYKEEKSFGNLTRKNMTDFFCRRIGLICSCADDLMYLVDKLAQKGINTAGVVRPQMNQPYIIICINGGRGLYDNLLIATTMNRKWIRKSVLFVREDN